MIAHSEKVLNPTSNDPHAHFSMTARALYDFHGNAELGELSFAAGDVIAVTKQVGAENSNEDDFKTLRNGHVHPAMLSL